MLVLPHAIRCSFHFLKKERHDHNRGVSETFAYDSLSRLISAELHPATDLPLGVSTLKEYRYDEIGNLTYKSDVGTYVYDGAGGAGPHAVTEIQPATTTWRYPAYAGSYTYDANGNQLSGAAREVTYTSFNNVATVSRGGLTVAFGYDPEHRRIVQTAAAAQGYTHYIGADFERYVEGTDQFDRVYIRAEGELIAINLRTLSNNSNKLQYVHTDYRQSTETVTDTAGDVLENLSYDPHGKRRLMDWTDAPTDLLLKSSVTARGFTGHEHVEEFDLIHAQGRVYDPVLGRFLIPDPLVQEPYLPQNLNRYSYVLNNPTSLYDPSGYSFKSFFKEYGRIIAAVVVAAVVAWYAPYAVAPLVGAILVEALMDSRGISAR